MDQPSPGLIPGSKPQCTSSKPYTCISGGDAAALALVMKVAKLEATLRQERAMAEEASAPLQALVLRLEAQVTLEAERRLSEQLRAIIEGVLHWTLSFVTPGVQY